MRMLVLAVYSIPLSWTGFWEKFGHINNSIMPFAIIASTVLPFAINMDGYRLEDKMKDMIVQNGGKTYVLKVNGEKFEFIEDPFGSVVRRSLKTGKYWITYQGVDYYYHKDFKKWVNPKTYTSFDDEHPGLIEKAKEQQGLLIAKLQQEKQLQALRMQRQNAPAVIIPPSTVPNVQTINNSVPALVGTPITAPNVNTAKLSNTANSNSNTVSVNSIQNTIKSQSQANVQPVSTNTVTTTTPSIKPSKDLPNQAGNTLPPPPILRKREAWMLIDSRSVLRDSNGNSKTWSDYFKGLNWALILHPLDDIPWYRIFRINTQNN
eukprot:NODE_170_length_14437_cov_1.447273.p5 type:complete len:320 gc:universal NODE_170_length_14437_cov_1.447273:1099-140(-)